MTNTNLTSGSIFKSLLYLALPIMGTSFIQMAYNLTDIMWVGRLGSFSVAAVGTGGFFTWFSMAVIFISKIGAEVRIAQAVGRNDKDAVKGYVKSSVQINILMALIYMTLLLLFKNQLIGFFNLGNQKVIDDTTGYLTVVSFGMIFSFMNPLFTSIWNGYGNSVIAFRANAIGLIFNMVLDPLFIFGFKALPALGVNGAAIATVISQMIVFFVFIYCTKYNKLLFSDLDLFKTTDKAKIKDIIALGLPAALQSGMFTVIAMVIARIVAAWGPVPVAVQRVGSQIEAISWMTAGGFSTAIGAFIGQNLGAERNDRIYKGYIAGVIIALTIGLSATILLVFFGKPVFTLFLPETQAIDIGVTYLKILGYSQIFMCIEIITSGAFNGLGRTVPPSIVGIALNLLRIPLAVVLSGTAMGLDGVWWSISVTSIFKGIILFMWFSKILYAMQKNDLENNIKLCV